MKLFDMHCHLDFLPDDEPLTLANQGIARGIGAFSTTVTPAGYSRAQSLLAHCPEVHVGVGLHPWWVKDQESKARADAERLAACITQTRFIGEIGLDFAPRHHKTAPVQIETFEHVLDTVVSCGGDKVLSIHAVRSADKVLDMLEVRDIAKNNIFILHWFSGSSEELIRALRLGCYFSVGVRMLESKRGRAYVRRIPHERMLLETDMPAGEGSSYSVDEWERDLRTALTCAAQTCNQDEREFGEIIAHTSARILTGKDTARSITESKV